jgi:hypothetical protein
MPRFFKRSRSAVASSPDQGTAPPSPVAGMVRADRRRRSRRLAAHRRAADYALSQERLEPRIALAVNVAGYEDAVDFFVAPGAEIDPSGSGYRTAPHSPQHFVHGRAVIASDDGDDLYIRQVASTRQDLIVSSASSFLNYQIIDGIDERYQQLFVTNGTLRVEAEPILPDFVPSFDAEGNYQTRFMLTREEIFGVPAAVIAYEQSDGTVSRWSWTIGGGLVPLSGPAAIGHIEPVDVRYSNVTSPLTDDVQQSYFDVLWSGVPVPGRRLDLTTTYQHFDDSPAFGTVSETVFANAAYAETEQRFTLPGARATVQDGVSLRESLGVIPGTFRGESGAIKVRWSDGVTYDLPAFRADVNGVLRFNMFAAPVTYAESPYKDSSAYFQPAGMGVIDVRGFVSTSGAVTLVFRKWVQVDDPDFSDELGRDWLGFGYEFARALPGVPGPVTISDVSYLTYTRDAEPNSVTFIAGQTISREVTVDLLTPGSTLNIDSPIRVNTDALLEANPRSASSYFQSVNDAGFQLPDIDFRATNINIRAAVTTPDRFSVGRSQVARERLSIPRDDVNPYLHSPSMPSLYDREAPETPILPNGGFPELRTAQVIAEVGNGGRVVGLTPLPGFQGFGYDPDNPPAVTIAPPPTATDIQATAEALVGPDGTIVGYLITNPGSGYTGIPAVTVAAPIPQSRATARVASIDAAAGQVVRIDVLDPGYRYHAAPRVVIAPPSQTGFGLQATARAILDSKGRIDRIEVVNPGNGYTERPEVTIAAPSPLAMAERLNIEAEVRAQVYEIYVGDDFGTPTPRGLATVNANGSLSTAPVAVQITSIVLPPAGAIAVNQRVVLSGPGGTPFPPGVNPVGVSISGFGIREGTRVLEWDSVTFTATLPLDSVSPTLAVPSNATLAARSVSLYLEATQADVIFEGLVNVDKQSYLFNSAAAANYLAPFTFTTRSQATGQHTGTIEGSVVDLVLGNDALPPLTGSTAFHDADLRTRVDSLRVRAASSVSNPQGPFPYRLTVEEIDRISLDAVAGSSGPISVSAVNGIRLTSVLDTDGDVSLVARTDQANAFADLQVTAPVRTRFGQIAISADTVEIRNSLAVSAAAVRPGRQDIAIEARAGDLVLQGELYAVNDVLLEQVNRVASVSDVLITRVNPTSPGDTNQTIVLGRPGGGSFPLGFNPVGRVLSGVGIVPGTTIEAWNSTTGVATVKVGNVGVVAPPTVAATISPSITTVFPGRIDGDLARIVAAEMQVLAEGQVSLRTDVNRLNATAGTGFTLSELNDITIPLLSSGGLVSLEALGVDLGPRGVNPVALSANLLDVTNLVVNTPNGSARIDANTDRELLVGDAATIQRLGDRAPTMLAAGNVTIRSQAGDVTLLDAPIAGGNARPVRVVTAAALPSTTTYLPGNPGVTPSSLSGAGSLNAITYNVNGNPQSFWGTDGQGRPITLAVGDLVLVKNQERTRLNSTPNVDHTRENGIYRVASVGGGAFGSQRWQLLRDAAFDTAAEMPAGMLVRVLEGPSAGKVFTIGYDSILPTLVERISTNQLQFPELFPNFDLLRVGMVVNGAGIAPDSFIAAIDPVARVVTLDVVDPGQVFSSGLGKVAVGSASGDTITLGPAFTDYPALSVGQSVTGAGILPGAVITRADPVTKQIDLAAAIIGPADVSLNGIQLQFDPLFTLFGQLEPRQQVQLFDGESTLLDTRTISAVDPATKTVTLDAPVGGIAVTARVWTPGALPAVLTGTAAVPVATARANSVVFSPVNSLAGVRVGQRFRFVDAGGAALPGVATRTVASLTIRVDGSTVVGHVTLGFGTLLSPAELTAVAAPGTRVEFLPPDTVEFGVAAPNSVPVTWNTWTADNVIKAGITPILRSVAIASGPGDDVRSAIASIPSEQVAVPLAPIRRGAGTASIELVPAAAAWFSSAVVGQTVQFVTAAGALIAPEVAPLLGGNSTTVALLPPASPWFLNAVVGQSVQFLNAGGAVVGTAAITALNVPGSRVELSDLIPAATVDIRRLNNATIVGLDPIARTVTLSEPSPLGAGQVRSLMNAVPLLRGVGTVIAGVAPYSPLFAVAEVGHQVEVLDADGTQVLGAATIVSLDPVTGSITLSAAIPARGGLLRDRHVVALAGDATTSSFVNAVSVGDTVQFLDVFGSVLPGLGRIDAVARDRGVVILDVPAPAGTARLRLPSVASFARTAPFLELSEVGSTSRFYDASGVQIIGSALQVVAIDQAAGWVRFDAPVPSLAAEAGSELAGNAVVLAAGDSFFSAAKIGYSVQFQAVTGTDLGGPLEIEQINPASGVIKFRGPVPVAAASLRLVGITSVVASSASFARFGVGNVVDFLSAGGGSLGSSTVKAVDTQSRLLIFADSVPGGASQVRVYSRILSLPNFAAFGELTQTLEVTGLNVPGGAVIAAIDPLGRTITLDSRSNPIGPVSAISFGIGPPARYPAADTLRLSPDFTNYERLFVGQRLFGAGIDAGAAIVSIDRAAGTIALTPRSVGTFRGPIAVTQRDSLASPYYPERFDDWLELDNEFNDFSELKIGQRVELRAADGRLLRVAEVTGVDARYRTVGLANGSLNGIAGQVETATFLPPAHVRFGVVEGVGSGLSDLLLLPVGLAPITVTEREVRTNIGTDSTAKTVTFVVSTDGRTNDATGSLGKMIAASQSNDPTRTQIDVAVIGVEPGVGGTWILRLDPLFTGYDRLLRDEPVFGTPRMFTDTARVVSVNENQGTVTLAAGSLSVLAIEDPNRVADVTLAIQTVNPNPADDFRFWQWTTGNVQLLQALPAINKKPITIDGSRTSAAGGSGPARLGSVFIDGQRIVRTNQGGQVTSGMQVDGLLVNGKGASGTRLANFSIGGFQRGSAIRIDGVSSTVVDNVRVGLSPTGARVPNARGITVTGNEATDNTILNSTVVGGTSAGIAIEGGASRTYIVGGAIGTSAIDNQVGVFVAAGTSETFIGVNPVLPSQPITASTRLTAGQDSLILPRTAFSGSLMGLGVFGAGIPVGAIIRGVDSAAGVVFLGNAFGAPLQLAESRTTTVTVGHVANRIEDADGKRNQLSLPPSVPLDDVFVGQRVTGIGIAANTVIAAIDRGNRVITLSLGFTGTGPTAVSFGAPPRTVVQRNRTGIILRGNSTRITNTDVADNTLNGIEVVEAGQQIGSPVAAGELGTVGVALASWPTTVSFMQAARVISLSSRFTGRGSDIGVGTPVFGAGIAAGTTVTAVTLTASGTVSSVTLSTPTTAQSSNATIGFGVRVGGVVQRIALTTAERERLFVGQTLHAAGLPEFTELVAFRLDAAGGNNQCLIVSAPRTGLSVTDFSALVAGPAVFAARTATSNRIYGSGRYGIRVFHDDNTTGTPTRISANYFGMLGETTEGTANRLGAMLVTKSDGSVNDGQPRRYQPSPNARVDLNANKYGTGDPTPTGDGSGIDPLPPRDPII